MSKRYTFPEGDCWSCLNYKIVGGITKYCTGFKRRKPRRFSSKDPSTKAPKWCPRRISPPICRIYGFKDERSEYMEMLFQHDLGNDDYLSPSAHHYTLRQELNLGLTAKRFYDEVTNHPLQEVFPPDVTIKDGEIVEIDDGLKPYYFYVKDFGFLVPLCFFKMGK